MSRPATFDEATEIHHRTVVAPVRIENALKAQHGLGVWDPRLYGIRAGHAINSAKLVGRHWLFSPLTGRLW